MTEHHRNDDETALRQALSRAVDDVTPAADALHTIRTRIEAGEGRKAAPARIRDAAADARWRLLARTRPGNRSAPAVASGQGLATGDYVAPASSGVATSIRGRGRKAAMAVAGIFALLTTGLAVNQLTASDGAATPEAAVHAFFDAIDQEDPLGVLESLTPEEREVLVPSVRRLAEQLQRFDVADGRLDLEHVDGLDLQVKGLQLRTQGLHPDVASVQVTGGTIETSANFRELPLGKALTAALDEEGGQNLDEPLTDSIPLDLTLATIRTGDRWHVSLLYSVAEKMREDKGAPVPDFGNGIPAKGADSPEAAVQAMVAAFSEQDFNRMIELTPPDSAAVLHDYGPVLLDDERDDPTLVIDEVKLGEPRGSGDRRTLTVEGYRMVQSYGGDSTVTYVLDGDCVTTTDIPDVTGPGTSCPYEAAPTVAFGFSFAPINLALWGPGPIELTAVERDDAWYVEPALSAIATLLADVESADSQAMNRAVKQWSARVSSDDDAWYATVDLQYYEYCTDVPAPSADASFEERKAAGRACVESQSGGSSSEAGSTMPTTPVVEGGGEAEGGSEGDGTFSAFARCQEQGDPAAVEACVQGLGDPEILALHHTMVCKASGVPSEVEVCLQDLVDEGEVDPSTVARYRCESKYEALGRDDIDAYDVAYTQCMHDAGFGSSDGESSDGDDGEVQATTTSSTPN